MKKIFTIVIAAAAFMTLASCQKMEFANNNGEAEKTGRVITGELPNDSTKTILGANDKPLWSVGDVIRVLNATSYEDITLTSSNIDSEDASKISFTTTLEGMLYAVYPASATAMTSCRWGNVTFTIPAVQDGTFGSANICVASGDGSTGNSIYFSNAVAVIEMNLATDVVGTKFEATNNIAGGMTVAMGSKGAIKATTPSLSSKTISVSDTKAPAGSKFYLAVAPVETGSVTISCNTLSKSGSTGRTTKTLAKNKIYAMNLSTMTIGTDFDPTGQHGVNKGVEYVIIKAKYDGTNDSFLKWATQNLAVTASGKAKYNGTNYVMGDYFAWAAYDGYVSGTKPENLVIYTSFTYTTSRGWVFIGWKDSKEFIKDFAPYGGSSYTKYTGASGDGKTVLELADDVANIVLGGNWRMPTGEVGSEYEAMLAVTSWTWDGTDKGYYVTKKGESLLLDKSNALLFFPSSGYGVNTDHFFAGDSGYYWSSTLSSRDTNYACLLSFNPTHLGYKGDIYRYCGFSVRAVSE